MLYIGFDELFRIGLQNAIYLFQDGIHLFVQLGFLFLPALARPLGSGVLLDFRSTAERSAGPAFLNALSFCHGYGLPLSERWL
jgi:hypothetical protein